VRTGRVPPGGGLKQLHRNVRKKSLSVNVTGRRRQKRKTKKRSARDNSSTRKKLRRSVGKRSKAWTPESSHRTKKNRVEIITSSTFKNGGGGERRLEREDNKA